MITLGPEVICVCCTGRAGREPEGFYIDNDIALGPFCYSCWYDAPGWRLEEIDGKWHFDGMSPTVAHRIITSLMFGDPVRMHLEHGYPVIVFDSSHDAIMCKLFFF